MSNPISKKSHFTQSRRNFLKGVAYTSALSIGGISSLASAMNNADATTATDKVSGPVSRFTDSDISVMQQQMLHKEAVTLFNNSDKSVMLDALRPVLIERANGSLIVKPNIISSAAFTGMIMLQPRQRICFDIQTTGGLFSSAEIQDVSKLEGQLLHITSEHSAFNQLIPVSSADSVIA